MKKLIILVLIIMSTQLTTAQVSGVAEQDHLLEMKDKMFLLCGNCVEYKWLNFKWLMWVNGDMEKKCIYKIKDSDSTEWIAECPKYGETSPYMIRDTLIKVPKPISYERFMDWRCRMILNE